MYNTKSNKVKKNNILTFYFKQIAKEKSCYDLCAHVTICYMRANQRSKQG